MSATGSKDSSASRDEGWQQVTSGRKTIHIIRPGQPGAAEAIAAANEQRNLSRKQQHRKEKRKAAAAQFRAEVTEPLQAATQASKVELGLNKPKKNRRKQQRQQKDGAAAAAPAPAASAAPAPSTVPHAAPDDAEDEGFGDIQIPLATSAPQKAAAIGGGAPQFIIPDASRSFVPMNMMVPVSPVAAVPSASPALTPPPPCVSPSLWVVNKDAFKSEQQTRSRLLQALAAVDNYPPMGKEYPKVDLEELCNALNVPLANVLTRETATKEEILEDAFLVLAYALEQCNEHVYLSKLMPKYLSTLPADDNVKATINTDTPLVDSYMRAKTTTRLNVDWKTGKLCAPIFRAPAAATTEAAAPPAAAAAPADAAATAPGAAAAAPKKKQHKTKYDKWMEKLGWNSMNKTRQLYILWNNYYVTSGRKDVWEVATDAYNLDRAPDADELIAKLKADGQFGPVGQLPYRLPVWTNQKEWKKAPSEQHQRHIDWRAYEHNISDGHCIMVARLTRVFGEPWSVRNSIHHLGKFLKQFREVVRIKEGLNHLHADATGVDDPIVRSSSPAPPALSSVAHVIAEMKKVVTMCGPHIILLPQMLALTSGATEGCENDAEADHSKDTLNGTVLSTHPVIGKILAHASRILMNYYYENSQVESPVLKASETPDEMYAVTDEQLYQYNLVRILWAVQQVAVDISGATLAIVFRNEVGHACEHAELGYRDGYKIVCAVHGYLRIPSRPSTPSGRGSRPSTPTPRRSTTPTTPTSPRNSGISDSFSSPSKK